MTTRQHHRSTQRTSDWVVTETFKKLFDPLAPLPQRTGHTSLSDDELLLFDFLFDRQACLESLRREAYPIHMNVRYTHALDQVALQKTVAQLVSAGWLSSSYHPRRWPGQRSRITAIYRLTPAGGRLWELERKPPWKQYCTQAHLMTKMVVSAPRLATARAFLYVWQTCGLFINNMIRVKVLRRTHRRLVPWKVFPTSYELHAYYGKSDFERRGIEETGGAVLGSWECYERNRTWWRSMNELVTL